MPYLLAARDPAVGDDDDLAVFLKRHHFGHAVGLTAVIDVARRPARHRGINHRAVRDAEHVHATILKQSQQQNTSLSY